MMKHEFILYGDEVASLSLGELTIKNGRDCLALSGSLDLARDQIGLKLAQRQLGVLAQAVQTMQADPALPARIALPEKPGTISNPFR